MKKLALPSTLKLKQSQNEVKNNTSKVGQAVSKILSSDHSTIEVEDILDQYQYSYVEEVKKAVETSMHKYESPFHIVVLHKKEPWALNVLRNWFVSRQTQPSPYILRQDYPNHMHTVYRYDARKEKLDLLWSLPSSYEADTILKNAHLYHSDLVKWIQDFNAGILGKNLESK